MRTMCALFAAMAMLSSQAMAFMTTCKLDGIAKAEGTPTTSTELNSISDAGKVSIKQSGAGNSATVVQSGSKGVTVLQSNSQGKKVDIATNDKRTGKLEFYQSHKQYDGKPRTLYVPIPQGMDMELKNMSIFITATGEGELPTVVTVSDNAAMSGNKTHSLKISQHSNACDITVTPPVKGELVFSVISERKVLIKVGGNY